MSVIEGSLSVNGIPRNGATAKLYAAASFSVAPVYNTPLPTANVLQTTTTGRAAGQDGGYRFTVSSPGEWYVGVEWNGITVWDYFRYADTPNLNILDYGAHSIEEPGYETFDSSVAINAAIQTAIGASGGLPEILIPNGKYRIDSPILIARITGGNTWQFGSLRMRGLQPTSEDSQNTTEIIPSFNDKPAIVVQYAREVVLEDFLLTGQNDVSSIHSATLDLLTNASWTVSGAVDNRYSPYAGICVDPFHSGIASGSQYAGLSAYYAYTAGPGTNAGSSHVFLNRVHVRKFTVGFMLTPASTVQQGDVIRLKDCKSAYCKSAIAIGQSQSRGVIIDGGEYGHQKFFVNCDEYGQQTGPPPIILAPVVTYTKYLFSYGTTYGCAPCIGLYAESTQSLGYLGGDTASQSSALSFEGCTFHFATDNLRPDFHIRSSCPVIFTGCEFNSSQTPMSVWTLTQHPIIYNGCFFDLNLTGIPQNYRSANLFVAQEVFNDCTLVDSVIGPTGSLSHLSRRALRYTPTYNGWDGSLMVPGAIVQYQNTTDIHVAPAAWNTVSLGSGITVTPDGSGGATFTATQNADLLQVGDNLHTLSGGWATEAIPTAAGVAYTINNCYLGQVSAISGNDVTLKYVPIGLGSGTAQQPNICWMPRFHQAASGVTVSGSTSVSGVTAIGNWKVGQRIQATGIAKGNFVAGVSGSVITLGRAATVTSASGGTRLFDADVGLLQPGTY